MLRARTPPRNASRKAPTSATTTPPPATTTPSGGSTSARWARTRCEAKVDEGPRPLARRPFGDALEIGSGTGYFSLNLVQLGLIERLVATDISPGMLAELRSTAGALGLHVRTETTDAERLPFDDGTFISCSAHHPASPTRSRCRPERASPGAPPRKRILRLLRRAVALRRPARRGAQQHPFQSDTASAAVDAKGKVVLYNGKVANTLFFSTSGGRRRRTRCRDVPVPGLGCRPVRHALARPRLGPRALGGREAAEYSDQADRRRCRSPPHHRVKTSSPRRPPTPRLGAVDGNQVRNALSMRSSWFTPAPVPAAGRSPTAERSRCAASQSFRAALRGEADRWLLADAGPLQFSRPQEQNLGSRSCSTA